MTLAARIKEVLALTDNAEALHKASPMMMNTPDSVHAYDVAADAAYSLIRDPGLLAVLEEVEARVERAHGAGFTEASRIHGLEIEALRAKLAAMEANDARYRWLRDVSDLERVRVVERQPVDDSYRDLTIWGESLDLAIDAARGAT